MVRSETDITKFMFIDDYLTKSDLIIIPGTSQVKPINIARDLLKEGISDKILISGGENTHLNGVTEAEYLAKYAIELGVPKEDILLENKAKNSVENAIFSKKICNELGLVTNRVILITKNYHSRRILETFERYFSRDTEFFIKSYVDNKRVEKHSWYEHDSQRDIIYSEIKKIGKYYFKNRRRYHDK